MSRNPRVQQERIRRALDDIRQTGFLKCRDLRKEVTVDLILDGQVLTFINPYTRIPRLVENSKDVIDEIWCGDVKQFIEDIMLLGTGIVEFREDNWDEVMSSLAPCYHNNEGVEFIGELLIKRLREAEYLRFRTSSVLQGLEGRKPLNKRGLRLFITTWRSKKKNRQHYTRILHGDYKAFGTVAQKEFDAQFTPAQFHALSMGVPLDVVQSMGGWTWKSTATYDEDGIQLTPGVLRRIPDETDPWAGVDFDKDVPLEGGKADPSKDGPAQADPDEDGPDKDDDVPLAGGVE